jgi:uncharacterized Zn finger protein
MEQPQFNIDITQTTPVVCEECGCEHFTEVSLMRKLSPMLSPTGQAAMIPIPVYACAKCGHVNKEFLPREPNDTL